MWLPGPHVTSESGIGVSVGRTAVLISALYLACSVAQPAGHPFFDVRELVSNRPLLLTYLRTALAVPSCSA